MTRHRWESFFNFIRTIDVTASAMTFDQFTRERLDWLPTQSTYLDRSTSWVRLETLRDGLADHGLAFGLESLPVRNETGFYVRWTDEAYERVVERYRGDFARLGYRIHAGPTRAIAADPVPAEAIPAEPG